jgi:hypothetical protein
MELFVVFTSGSVPYAMQISLKRQQGALSSGINSPGMWSYYQSFNSDVLNPLILINTFRIRHFSGIVSQWHIMFYSYDVGMFFIR